MSGGGVREMPDVTHAYECYLVGGLRAESKAQDDEKEEVANHAKGKNREYPHLADEVTRRKSEIRSVTTHFRLVTSSATRGNSWRFLRIDSFNGRFLEFHVGVSLKFTLLYIEFPEKRPEIGVERIQARIAGNDCATKRPTIIIVDQPSPHWIRKDIAADLRKGIPISLLFPQHVIVGLMLPFPTISQQGLQLGSQKFDRIDLVARSTHSHPKQMKVVWHQAVTGAPDVITGYAMQCDFPKGMMKFRC
jgi:hypothetical protein